MAFNEQDTYAYSPSLCFNLGDYAIFIPMVANFKKKSPKLLMSLERVLYLLSFGIISYGFLSLLLKPLGVSSAYAVILNFTALIGYTLLLISLSLVWGGAVSRGLINTLRAVSGLALITMAIFLFGLLQDTLGVQCAGLFGVKTSCMSDSSLWLEFFISQPLLFLPAAILISVLLAWGIKSALNRE